MTFTAQARELRALASALDAQRGKLPILDHPHRAPEPVGVSNQITELVTLIEQLNHRILIRAANDLTEPETARITTALAAALEPAGRAVAALGHISHQLAFLDETWPLRDRPALREAIEAAHACIDDALAEADAALEDAAKVLHAASTSLVPPSRRLQAALSRTTTTGARPSTKADTPTAMTATTPTTARSR